MKEKKNDREGKKREEGGEKIGPMVIDYLPRIPRIPYIDRPHGPKIEPSITGVCSTLFPSRPFSYFLPPSPSLSLSLFFSLPCFFSTSFGVTVPAFVYFSYMVHGTRNFERIRKRVALIKRPRIWHLLHTPGTFWSSIDVTGDSNLSKSLAFSSLKGPFAIHVYSELTLHR